MGTSCTSDSTYDTHRQQHQLVHGGDPRPRCLRTDKPVNEVPSEVASKMAAQEAAWNAGDIPSFMDIAYWQDDALLFVGSKGPTYGFEATLNNYLKSYASPEEMGQLRFELLEWKTLGPKHGFLLGSWALDER